MKADGSQQDAQTQPGASAAVARAEERDLVERFRRGDRAAFERIVELHEPRVRRLAFRLMGWRGEAEDVVQEVFVAAIENLGRFRGESGLATWLAALTINQCRCQRRRRRLLHWLFRQRRRNEAEESKSPDQPAAEAERSKQVRDAVRNLPARYREVIVLRYLEEMSVEQIGQVLRLSGSAVEVRLHRGREQLRQVLREI